MNYDDLLHMNCDHFHIAQGVSSDAVSWPKRVRIWAAAPWYHFCQVRNSLIKMCFYSLLKTYFAAQQARHSSSHRQGRATQPQRARHRTQTPLHRWSSWSCWSCWSWSSWWLRCGHYHGTYRSWTLPGRWRYLVQVQQAQASPLPPPRHGIKFHIESTIIHQPGKLTFDKFKTGLSNICR